MDQSTTSLTCTHCGLRYRPQIVKANAKFCSRSCKADATIAANKAILLASKHVRQCARCGGEMGPAFRKDAIFCSIVCKKKVSPPPCVDCGGVARPRQGSRGQYPMRCLNCHDRSRLATSNEEVRAKKSAWYRASRATLPPRVCVDCGFTVGPSYKRCAECRRIQSAKYTREYNARNPEKAKAASRKYMAQRRLIDREGLNLQKRLVRYGMTLETLNCMRAAQEYRCFICRVPEDEIPKGFYVDHDHACCSSNSRKTCGKCVRALLCGHCNTAIGYMNDDPARLRAAADYLERNSHGY